MDAPIGPRGVDANGYLESPRGPGDVAWYDLSSWPGGGLGGTIGGGRNAVFSAHVDYDYVVPYAGVHYAGQGAFAGINSLEPGAMVEIQTPAGEVMHYEVVWRKQLSGSDREGWREAYTSAVPVDSITLISCEGDFNVVTRDYSHRTVVRAERVPAERPAPAPAPAPLAPAPAPAPLAPATQPAGNRLPVPAVGAFTYGIAGTDNPGALAAMQRFDVAGIWAQDEASGEWLSYLPGAPPFANTLTELSADTFVILKRR